MGRLLGLDRLPEVKTLRVKITLLCATAGQAGQWQTRLAREWIAAATDPFDTAGQGRFCVDGHLRVYRGGHTSLTRRYVARQRLCLRGTTDYWGNAGLLAALREHVIPPLLASVPAAPANGTATTLLANACAPGAPRGPRGVRPRALRAGTVGRLPRPRHCDPPRPQVPRRGEARVQVFPGHAALTLRRARPARMPDRWTQENFLHYRRRNFGRDRMIESGLTPLPDPTVGGKLARAGSKPTCFAAARTCSAAARGSARWGCRSHPPRRKRRPFCSRAASCGRRSPPRRRGWRRAKPSAKRPRKKSRSRSCGPRTPRAAGSGE